MNHTATISDNIHVLGISGSLRRGSHNSGLLRAAAQVLPKGMTLEVFNLGSVPVFNGDLAVSGEPQNVLQFKERIADADALLIATLEYNYSIPGVLKNAIDWASRPPKHSPLNRKPLAMMGAGGVMGTIRAQLHLRQILLYNDLRLLNKPEVYVTRSWEKFDGDGNLKDEATLQSIRALLEALGKWTLQLRGNQEDSLVGRPASVEKGLPTTLTQTSLS
jgi:chromate reductase